MTIPDEKKQKIIQKIQSKAASISCSVCNEKKFTLVDGFVNQSLQNNVGGGLVIGGPTLPSAVLVCNNCGNTLFFNLVVLGDL